MVEALAANGCFSPTSLDATPADAEGGIGDRLGDDDASFDSAEARVALKPLLAHLDRRERIMLEMRFFKGATQSEIGEVLGHHPDAGLAPALRAARPAARRARVADLSPAWPRG